MEVLERNEPVWEEEHKWRAGSIAALRLGRAELRLARASAGEADALLIGYPGHADLPAARRVARGRPVVFNPLVSLYDTLVEDRRRFRPRSPAARALKALDRRALRSADLVVADTEANARYLAELAGLPAERLTVCFVGAEERLFQPARQPTTPFEALFVGKLIPLHGVETILAAARLAPDVRF
ncbi:MAG: glycosyltransferase, partial [Gaiellaceae bacterium]